jgi:cold shock CspA family protein
MQVPLEIAARNVMLSPEAEAEIRDRVNKLESIYGSLVGCRVAVDRPHRRRRTGAEYGVRVDLTVPGGELAVGRKTGDTPLTAIQNAFGAAERRLRRYAERQRGDVKQHTRQPSARVREIYPLGGYGFLETAEGETVYFDARSVLNGGFDRLEVGSPVRFVAEQGVKGPQASTVTPAK